MSHRSIAAHFEIRLHCTVCCPIIISNTGSLKGCIHYETGLPDGFLNCSTVNVFTVCTLVLVYVHTDKFGFTDCSFLHFCRQWDCRFV